MTTTPTTPSHDIEVFFDGACPLCTREIDMLRRRDRHGRVRFTDLTRIEPERDADGRTRDELMARIHGRLSSGEWIEGVEVFRHLYDAAGFGLLVRLSRLPGIRQALDLAYTVFAANRLRLTGRCADGTCALPHDPEAPSPEAAS